MKKNLLFIIPSLSAGGGEKSLVNLLSQIDFEKYNVDLFLLNHDGLFMGYLPKEVNVLSVPEKYKTFSLPINLSIIKFLAQGKYLLAYNRILYSLKNRSKHTSIREQYNWKYLSKSLEDIEKHYDVAIGFLEKTSTYFCVDKVKASHKIGWVHNDYDKLGMDPNFDSSYFKKLNQIITVSEECASVFSKRFPDEKSKVSVIYNIISPTLIKKLANQEKDYELYQKKKEVVILSIGRLHYQKAFERAIEATRKLIDRGHNIKWNIIGEGEERGQLTNLIKELGLEDNIQLLGLKSNPYPYIKQADIYVQTSRFEGKSIAIDEAKILSKPIVITNFSTAKDQIEDGINGLIVDMTPDAIANGIERLIWDKELRHKLIENLSNEKLGTEEEIYKFYKIL